MGTFSAGSESKGYDNEYYYDWEQYFYIDGPYVDATNPIIPVKPVHIGSEATIELSPNMTRIVEQNMMAKLEEDGILGSLQPYASWFHVRLIWRDLLCQRPMTVTWNCLTHWPTTCW